MRASGEAVDVCLDCNCWPHYLEMVKSGVNMPTVVNQSTLV